MASAALFDTRQTLSSATVDAAVNTVWTGGYSTPGDGGDALYKRVATQPAHAGKVQSADGAWWELVGNSVRSRQIGLPTDGNVYTGVGTDGAPILNLMTNDAALTELLIDPTYDLVSSTHPGGTVIATPVSLPYTVNLRGSGKRSKIIFPAGTPPTTGYISWNVYPPSARSDLIGTPVTFYAWSGAQIMEGLSFDARAAAAADVKVTGIVFSGLSEFRDIYAYGLQTLLRQAASWVKPDGTPVSPPGVEEYSDFIRIERVAINDQPTTDDYAIKLDSGAGDGLFVNQVTMNYYDGGGDPSKSRRGRLLHVKNRGSGLIKNVINGDIRIESSKVSLASIYQETGRIEVQSSDVSIRDSVHYMRNEVCGELAVEPIYIQDGQFLSSNMGNVVLDNVAFQYSCGLFGQYSTTLTNIKLDSHGYVDVHITDCKRFMPLTDNRGDAQRIGITTGVTDFDRYSHLASGDSRIRNHQLILSADRGPIRTTSTDGGNVISDSITTTNGALRWKIDSGTYYYKAAAYLDAPRAVGIIGSEEIVLSPTRDGAYCGLRHGWTLAPNLMMRIYRGTASGQYDSYVDVPAIMAQWYFDSGLDIGGYPWKSRTAGPADPVNTGLVLGIELRPGSVTATADAYGQARIYALSSALLPSRGSWRKGDQVLLIGAAPVSGKLLLGWERITDCTLASPSHVLGTDWVPMYSLTS